MDPEEEAMRATEMLEAQREHYEDEYFEDEGEDGYRDDYYENNEDEDVVDADFVDEREHLISQALSSDEGRNALAQAMVAPIRRSLDYQGVGRRFMEVSPMPQGALAAMDISLVNHPAIPPQEPIYFDIFDPRNRWTDLSARIGALEF